VKRIYAEIEQLSAEEINPVLKAVLHRYAELFPGWEISAVSIEKSEDRGEQIDRMIQVMEKLKAFP
jgi:hypothetical protein